MKKVLVGGCFNAIHEGHVYFLREAKKLGDYLVVVLTHDKNNKKPYAIPAKKRKEMLEKLGIANKIIIGDEKDKLKVVLEEKPQVIALGYDQKLPKEVEERVRELGIKVVRIKKYGKFSTRELARKKHA